jgi:hypothetical protein
MEECASGMGQSATIIFAALPSVPNKCRGGDCASGMEHIRKIIMAVAITVMRQQLIITGAVFHGEVVNRE